MEKVIEHYPQDVKLVGSLSSEHQKVLTPDAMKFLRELHVQFNEKRRQLLQNRISRQERIDQGELPDFLPETASIREGNWTVDPVPQDLLDRRVEITGPASDRKMVINAFNSGAKAFMADFEDSNSPTWGNTLNGQINLRDAINRTIEFTTSNGKNYMLNAKIATLIVRPRGWHLQEKHVLINDTPISASLFDFGLFIYHNGKNLLNNKSGPYFYLPKIESHLEARLWNDVFLFAQNYLEIPQGTIKATVLIETILATFEADEILYELKEHSAGLNCGRWDYIFSYIKKLRNHEAFILPNRSLVTMSVPFMRAYTLYIIKTCHKRDAHAIGGMAAQIPVKNDMEANDKAMDKVRVDKELEAENGHDGTWVAHPGLVPIALDVFDKSMPTNNQFHKKREEVNITAQQLLAVPKGEITEDGLRMNISVAIQYIEAWLRGKGAVPLYNLMEDAATAEISRAQVWQWIRHPKGRLVDGEPITSELVEVFIDQEMEKIKGQIEKEQYQSSKFPLAVNLFKQLVFQDKFRDFLTLPGYEYLI
ncbi:malate synthase A [Pseudalkalibacillus decolorationis]|uniref:malate synthase A n=1 Tax=Pseudalkalibacillus decolorationis TaxID=163879 RepID=UPI002148F989|nr:malate synthase A [Pseudalkalibacillus decolorationis]